MYHSLLAEMTTSWNRLGEDALRLKREQPDLGKMLEEAQTLQKTWESDSPSYLRGYLASGQWGQDSLWNSLVRKVYTIFLCMYLLPSQAAGWLATRLDGGSGKLPSLAVLEKRLPGEGGAGALGGGSRNGRGTRRREPSSGRTCDWS